MNAQCTRLREEAPALVALAPGHPQRSAAEAHARGCLGCAQALREATALHELLGEVQAGERGPRDGSGPPDVVEPIATIGAAALIARQLRGEGRRRAWAGSGAVAVVVALLLATARHPSRDAGDLALATLLAVGALLAAAFSRRWKTLAAGAAAALALAVAVASGHDAALAPLQGVECLLTELVAAGVVLGAVALTLRRSATRLGASAVATAAAGALAGAAALQLACPVTSGLPHQLVFHLGGVLVAAAGGLLLGGALRRRTAA